MNLSSINLRFFANIAPLVTGLNKAERALDQAGRKMQATGKKLTMQLTAPIVGMGAIAVNTFQAFELQMAKVKAVSGATAEEFKALEADAQRLGASTIFSASQVAELQTEFAKLGFTAKEITQVTEATLYLAQATDSDLARAAEVAGATLRGFGMEANETTRVTDVMAKSFSSSALDMEKFADSMKYVAPIANVAGVSLEETTAMLALLSNAGILGSQAGTSLRRIITDLGSESGTTAEKIAKLAAKGISMENAMDEVGRSAQQALIVLQQNVDTIPTLTTEFENSAGAASFMAKIMDETTSGAMKGMASAFEALMISVGKIIVVAFVPFVKMLTSVLQTLNSLPGPIKVIVVAIGGLVAAIGPLLFTFGLMQRNFIAMLPYLMKIGTALRFMAVQGLRMLIAAITPAVAALAALGAIAIYVGYNFEAFKAMALNAVRGFVNLGINYLNGWISVFNGVADALGMDGIKIKLFDKLEMEAVPKLKSISQVAKEVKRDVGAMFAGSTAAAVTKGAAEIIGVEGDTTGTGDAASGSGVAGVVSAFKSLKKIAPKSMHAVVTSMKAGAVQMASPIQQMTEQQINLAKAAIDLSKNISGAINAAAVNFAVGIGEMIGAAAAGGDGIASFGTFALQSLAGLLQQVGEMAIQTGIALLGIQVALKTLNPAIAIAGGIALVALASGIRTSLAKKAGAIQGGGTIPALAEGGIATGPTLALIGEGKGPEAVIPLDKLEGMMGGFGNQSNVVVTGRIQGSDILISSERAERQRSRYRGF
jgi:peptidoglycan hydrolase-like protein with peptidoglycan-binding domain